MLAIDKKNGRIRWERVAHEGVPKTKRHPKSSQASCTPVTDGKVVIAYFGSEGLYAYDVKGTLRWKQDVGRVDAGWFYDPDYEWGAASSPVIYKDLVIVQVDRQEDSFIAAYWLKDGRQAWRTAREEIPSWSTPTVYLGPPRDELVTQATRFIRAYDPATGKELWRLGPNSEVTAPTPIVADGLIVITNGYRGIQPIYAVASGRLRRPHAEGRSEVERVRRLEHGPRRSLHVDSHRVRGPALRPQHQRRSLRVRRGYRREGARGPRGAPTSPPSARRPWPPTASSTWPARTARYSCSRPAARPS